ncbi:hypothetical protein B0H15DRAFT_799308 [Mycena belliarum]|uniref:Uncharacterized protein n=1 Tax=Mycena belliarum TaxID=1033014 RepID=A0AAD6U7D6_9AGAR|nr:hypothetical protein B0H15DRAFT_799308 [Mycena belliae]
MLARGLAISVLRAVLTLVFFLVERLLVELRDHHNHRSAQTLSLLEEHAMQDPRHRRPEDFPHAPRVPPSSRPEPSEPGTCRLLPPDRTQGPLRVPPAPPVRPVMPTATGLHDPPRPRPQTAPEDLGGGDPGFGRSWYRQAPAEPDWTTGFRLSNAGYPGPRCAGVQTLVGKKPAPAVQLDDASWQAARWEDIRVGDFVQIRDNEPLPADILICATSEDEQQAFVKNLDGEANLKSRHAVPALEHLRDAAACAAPENAFRVDCERPNTNMYRLNGAVFVGDTPAPVDLSLTLLRGTVLRNTRWVIGLVLFTGEDTKIVLNSGGTPSKRSKVEPEMNPQVFISAVLDSSEDAADEEFEGTLSDSGAWRAVGSSTGAGVGVTGDSWAGSASTQGPPVPSDSSSSESSDGPPAGVPQDQCPVIPPAWGPGQWRPPPAFQPQGWAPVVPPVNTEDGLVPFVPPNLNTSFIPLMVAFAFTEPMPNTTSADFPAPVVIDFGSPSRDHDPPFPLALVFAPLLSEILVSSLSLWLPSPYSCRDSSDYNATNNPLLESTIVFPKNRNRYPPQPSQPQPPLKIQIEIPAPLLARDSHCRY